MHGDIAQNQREVTLKRFKEGKFNVLVATDVASRGLDIPNVDLVIQVEPPQDAETYIHRSGRTARAGNSGTCITFFNKKNQPQLQAIEDKAGVKFKIIGAPQPEDVIRASAKGIFTKIDEVTEDVLDLFTESADQLTQKFGGDKDKALKACLAFISGRHKTQMVGRSLLTGQEKMTTLEMVFNAPIKRENTALDQAWTYLRSAIPPKNTDNLRGIRVKKDGTGVIFDVWEDKVERFLYGPEYLRERDGKVDFDIFKCTALPELYEEDEYQGGGAGGQGWRAGGASSGYDNYGGGSSRGGYGSSRGGGGYQGQSSFKGQSSGGYGGYGRGSSGSSSFK